MKTPFRFFHLFIFLLLKGTWNYSQLESWTSSALIKKWIFYQMGLFLSSFIKLIFYWLCIISKPYSLFSKFNNDSIIVTIFSMILHLKDWSSISGCLLDIWSIKYCTFEQFRNSWQFLHYSELLRNFSRLYALSKPPCLFIFE